MGRLRVVILTGGTSSEREVCLMSGRNVLAALDPARYEANAVDLAAVAGPRAGAAAGLLFASSGCDRAQITSGDVPPDSAAAGAIEWSASRHPLDSTPNGRPDVVFIALHGGAGENGTVQGLLELLGIPYTGSGVLASALAINKIMSKKVFEREGIPTPPWVSVSSRDDSAADRILSTLGLPCVVKPSCEGSTIGISIVRAADQLPGALDTAFSYGPQVLVERFIAGTEITGPVLGNDDAQVLPLIEIVPDTGFYDYRAKYTAGATQEIVPARLPIATAQRARELTLRAHTALGCRGISRVDMIVGPDDVYVLEVNTIPGMTDTSLVPRAAEAAGISFPELVDRLVRLALEDRRGKVIGRGS
ncbi:MAG: D-alanine--D-alanine ligase [Armatimonadota bacterium]